MKILYPTIGYPPYVSGAFIAVQRLAEAFSLKNQVLVITFSSKGKACQVKKGNLTTFYLKSLKISKSGDLSIPLPQPKKIKTLLTKFQPDIIHVPDPFFGLSMISFAKKQKIPLVATHHFTPEFLLSKSPLLKPLLKKTKPKRIILKLANTFYNQCQAVTVPNPLILVQLKQAGLKIPAFYISNGVNLQLFNPKKTSVKTFRQFKLNPKIPTFIFTGRLSIEKNLPLLFKAFAHLLKSSPDGAQLLIIGSGKQEKKLKKLTKKINIQKSVFFTGKILDHNLLAQIYASSFALVNPSIIENQSLSTLEALASGIPVIATQSIGQKPLIKNKVNGLLVKPNNLRELTMAMKFLLKNNKIYQKMKIAARKSALRHDFNKTLDQFEKLYQTLIPCY